MKKGYTLIEVFITIILFSIVITFVFNIYKMQKTVYYKQKPVLEMIDKTMNSMNLIVKDFQNLGRGLGYYNIDTLYVGNKKVADNGDILFSFTDNADKDSIILYYFDINDSPLSKAEVDSIPNKIKIKMKYLTSLYTDPNNHVNLAYPVIFFGSNNVCQLFYVTDITGSSNTIKHKNKSAINSILEDKYFLTNPKNKATPSFSLPAYSYIVSSNNEFYKYYINNNILYRNGDVVASGIESLDIKFAVKKSDAEDKVVELDGSGNIKWYNNISEIKSAHPTYNQKDIRLVKIILVARSLKPIYKNVQATDDNPLTSQKEQDRYKRFVLVRVVKLMNIGGF